MTCANLITTPGRSGMLLGCIGKNSAKIWFPKRIVICRRKVWKNRHFGPISQKRYKIWSQLKWNTNRNSYAISWTVPFLNDLERLSYQCFNGMLLFGTWLQDRDNEILTQLTELLKDAINSNDLDWLWVKAKFPTTQSIARPLWDRWVSY